MKMRKVLAALAAAAVATTAMATVASAADYNAYIAFQTTQYSFRNGWSDASYGAATPYHAGSYIVWGAGDYPEETYPQYEDNFDYDINGYALPATYTDAVITGDGKATEYLVLDIIRKVIGVVLLGFAILLNKGIWLIAFSEVVSNFIAIFVNMYPGKKHIGYKIKEQITDVFPKFILSGTMFGAVYAMNSLTVNIYLKVILQIFAGIVIYFVGAKAFRMKELDELTHLARDVLKKGKIQYKYNLSENSLCNIDHANLCEGLFYFIKRRILA